MISLLDEGLDDLAANAHAGFAPRVVITAATAWAVSAFLPGSVCLTWAAVAVGLEAQAWFATRRQARRQAVGWRTRLWHVAGLAASCAAWVALGALAWSSGLMVGALCGVVIWLALIFFAQTDAYVSTLGFVISGVIPAIAVEAIVFLAPHPRGLLMTPFQAVMALALVFAGEGANRMRQARQRHAATLARMRQTDSLYRMLADNITDVITVADVTGKRVYMSPSTERALGYPLEELYQTPMYAYIHPDDRVELARKTRELARVGGDLTAQYRVLRADGEVVWVETNFTLTEAQDGGPAQMVSVARNISLGKQLEGELIEARRAAEAAAAAKSDFLANMTHELRTPLNAIIGFAGVLRDSPRLQGEDAHHVRMIGQASATLLDLVNDVLDFSRLEAGAVELDPAPFDPAAEARGLVDLLSGHAAAKGLSLSLRVEGEGFLCGDAKRLRQVLLNLLSNAIKFTGQGGVTLSVSQAPDGPDRARLRAEVADTGVGIPASQVGQVFERFTQADASVARRFGGTGLGLSICKRIVDLMGGEIGVESVEGQGAAFWFEVSLPTAERLAPPDEAPAPVSLDRPVRLLLVEDVAINRELVRTVLAPFDIEIHTAEDGVGAIAAFQERDYDLVLMDVQMPEMDGLTATRCIRALPTAAAAGTPIIAMTANVLPDQIARCLEAGMDGHLGKPMKPGELLQVIASWTSGERDRAAARTARAS